MMAYTTGFCLLQLFCTLLSGSATEPMYSAREVYVPCHSSCNNGLCDYTFGTCVCHPFYTGEQCDRPLILPCGDYYCFNEGTCEMNGSGKKYCQCPQGFSGQYCLTSDMTNEELCTDCGTYSCFNGGTCQNSTCQCSEGFGGGFCQYDCADIATSNEALQPCGRHYCYYGGMCINSSCSCPLHTIGVYCEYTTAPSGQLNVSLTGRVTSATLDWSVPVGYENIARYGGVWYTVHIQNMATGREETLTSSDTTHSHSLMHFTEYCFRVRPEVSGGAGNYSERQCYTSELLVIIAAPTAGLLVLLLLVAVTVAVVCYIWRVKSRRSRQNVNSLELSGIEDTGTEHGQEGNRTSTIVGNVDAVNNGSTEHIYQEIPENAGEMYEILDAKVTANPLVKADNDGEAAVTSHSSDPDGGDVYEDMTRAQP